MACEHKEKIIVSGLKYCKKCNKYLGEVRTLNPLIAQFFWNCCPQKG